MLLLLLLRGGGWAKLQKLFKVMIGIIEKFELIRGHSY